MNYHLCPINTNEDYNFLQEQLIISYRANIAYAFSGDDRVLVAYQTEQCILPYEFRIISIDKHTQTLVIHVTNTYPQALPFMAALVLLGGRTPRNYTQLTKQVFDAIVSLMNSHPLTNFPSLSREEKKDELQKNNPVYIIESSEDQEDIVFDETEVLHYVKDYIRNRGYYFEDVTLYNYHICLKTRPFVLLAGLSGTGKSKLAQLYAEALGHRKHFKRLPVRPNWNDDRYLLGYLNTITGEYITEPALDFILEAIHNQKHIYSICLDEMNLAHVEYYFSQFLSAMEEKYPEDRRITLLSQYTIQHLQGNKMQTLPAEIYLPGNLLFTGTINVDETTQPISDKVIDRANTIEFFDVNLNKIPEPKDPGEPLPISTKAWQSYQAQYTDSSYRSEIVEINDILKKADLGIGYRVVQEIELYLANSKNLLETQVAFDLQIKQRILPRVRGTAFVEGTLNNLLSFSKSNKLSYTEQRLNEMKNRLKRDGYTSFWR